MRRLFGLALFGMAMVCGLNARAAETEYDPAKVSESLKAIFQFGSTDTKKALNANTVTLISGTIGGTYVQFGADLASVLDDGNKLRVLPRSEERRVGKECRSAWAPYENRKK